MANDKLASPLAQRWGVGKPVPPGKVYIGGGYQPYTGGTPTAGYVPMEDMYADIEQASQGWASLSPSAQQKIYQDAIAVYGHEKVPALNMESFYADTVRAAAQVQQSRGVKVQPLEYWDYYRASGGPGLNAYGAGKSGGGGGVAAYKGPTTTVSTTESLNLTNPSTARQLLDAALSDVLGRLPTQKEYDTFRKALLAQQEEAPSVTESVTTTTPQGVARTKVKSKTKTTGGVSEAQLATEFARSQEGAAETLGGTLGFDAFLEAIGGQ